LGRAENFVHVGSRTVPITETWLKANHKKHRPKALVKTDRDGLGARVSPKGKITFQLRYYYNGSDEAKRVDLGSYPLMSLQEAREETQRLRKQLENGHDPRIVLQTEEVAIVTAEPLEGLFRKWYESYCKKKKKGHHEILRSFEIYVFPTLGILPVTTLTLHIWLPLLEALAEDVPGIADRILTNAKQFLKWCRKRQVISVNPLAEITAYEDLQIEKANEARTLTDDEIKRVWRAMERSRMALKNRVFTLLCLIYGNRSGELRLALKSDFDFVRMRWTVPPENHKIGKLTGKPLIRPIIPVTEFLIRLAMKLGGKSKYMFPAVGVDEPIKHSFCVQFPYNIMQYLRRYEQYEMPHWSMHDLRKTARTMLSRFTQWHVAEIALGHVLPGESRLYDNHDYMEELRQAYSAYWGHLAGLFAESRAEMQPTRRRFDPRQHLPIPGIDVAAPTRKIDQLRLEASASAAELLSNEPPEKAAA
jgi:integrase